MAGRLRRALLLGILSSASCAHAPLVCPDRGGTTWIELLSPHFALHTDLPPDEADPALAEFERTYAAFETVAFPSWSWGPRRSRARIDFIWFRREEDFRELAPSGASGFFLPRQENEVEPVPALVLHGASGAAVRHRFQHELTHRFLDERIADAPPWLAEGLAEYYSTLRLLDGEAVVGELPVSDVLVTELRVLPGLADQRVDRRVPIVDVPSLAELLRADERAFHEPAREAYFYVAAWALVHLLANASPDYAARFRAYCDALAAGVPADRAFAATLGAVPPEALARDYHDYLRRIELRARRLACAAPSDGARARSRPMSDEEVHLLWARIRPWDRRENIIKAGRDLERAVAPGRASAEAYYWMALYHRRWRRFRDAESDLRRALAVAPGEPRYRHALADLRSRAP